MKKVATLLTIAAVALLAVSCGKVEKILPKKDGEWQITYQKTVTTDAGGTVVDSETITDLDSLSQVHFEKDGTGHFHYPDGSSDNFTWSVNDDNDVITMTTTDASGVTTIMDWDVLESSSKEMSLNYEFTFTFLGTFTVKTDVTMERID